MIGVYVPGLMNSLYWGLSKSPLTGNPYNGYINPYYWVDDHPLLHGNNGSLDPSISYVFILTTSPISPKFLRSQGY